MERGEEVRRRLVLESCCGCRLLMLKWAIKEREVGTERRESGNSKSVCSGSVVGERESIDRQKLILVVSVVKGRRRVVVEKVVTVVVC